jgi:copper oxidase (laccase) domain-containing protein
MNAAHLAAPGLLAAGFAHGFSLPPGDFGVTPEGAAHATLARAVGYSLAALRTCRQVHGAAVLVDPSPDACAAAEADALVLRAGGAVGVRTADCASILLGDKRSGAVAAVHAGWRGVVAGVLPAAVRALVGARTGELHAALGPCIGGCCFEVGADVAGAISAACGPTSPGRAGALAPHVDLGRGGAGPARVARGPRGGARRGCTVCAPTGWHSFRRDGSRSGRMLAVIAASQR